MYRDTNSLNPTQSIQWWIQQNETIYASIYNNKSPHTIYMGIYKNKNLDFVSYFSRARILSLAYRKTQTHRYTRTHQVRVHHTRNYTTLSHKTDTQDRHTTHTHTHTHTHTQPHTQTRTHTHARQNTHTISLAVAHQNAHDTQTDTHSTHRDTHKHTRYTDRHTYQSQITQKHTNAPASQRSVAIHWQTQSLQGYTLHTHAQKAPAYVQKKMKMK